MRIDSSIKKYLTDVSKIWYYSDYCIILANDKKYYYKNITYSLKDLLKYFDSVQFDVSLIFINSFDDNYLLCEYDSNNNFSSLEFFKSMVNHLIVLQQKSMTYEVYVDKQKKELYDKIFYSIQSTIHYYEKLEGVILEFDFPPPKYYLLLRNISKIYRLLYFSLNKLDEWYCEDQKEERLSFLVKNVCCENYSYSNCSFYDYGSIEKGLFFYDFVSFYKKEYKHVDMNLMFCFYKEKMFFSKAELSLFYCLISIPDKVSFTSHSYADTVFVSRLIEYLDYTEMFLSKETKENQEADEKILKQENEDI